MDTVRSALTVGREKGASAGPGPRGRGRRLLFSYTLLPHLSVGLTDRRLHADRTPPILAHHAPVCCLASPASLPLSTGQLVYAQVRHTDRRDYGAVLTRAEGEM